MTNLGTTCSGGKVTGTVIAKTDENRNVQVLWLARGSEVAVAYDEGAMIAEYRGDAIPTSVASYSSFAITKPEGCEITVIMDAGTITLGTEKTAYFSDVFSCPLDLFQLISTDGSAADCLAETCVNFSRT